MFVDPLEDGEFLHPVPVKKIRQALGEVFLLEDDIASHEERVLLDFDFELFAVRKKGPEPGIKLIDEPHDGSVLRREELDGGYRMA